MFTAIRYDAAGRRVNQFLAQLADETYPEHRATLLYRCAAATRTQAGVYTDAYGPAQRPDDMDVAQSLAWAGVIYGLLADVEEAVAYPARGRRDTTTELEGVAGDILDAMAAEPDLTKRHAMLGRLYDAVRPVTGAMAAATIACLPVPIAPDCDHPWPVEVRLSDCPHGCKIMQCGCGATFTAHSRTYGCRTEGAV